MQKKYTDFIPKSDAELIIWLGNFLKRFPELASECLPHTPSNEVSGFLQEGRDVIGLIGEVNKGKALFKALVRKKDLARKNFLKTARAYITMIKVSKNYNKALAAGAGIISSSQTIDINNICPEIKVVARTGYVEIAFNKQHVLPIAVFSRFEGEYDWQFIGNEDTSPFIDKRPLREEFKPERREYMAMYTNIKHTIGLESAISVVTFG